MLQQLLLTVPYLQGVCANMGKVILAAVPAESMYVHLFEINDEVRCYEHCTAFVVLVIVVLDIPALHPCLLFCSACQTFAATCDTILL